MLSLYKVSVGLFVQWRCDSSALFQQSTCSKYAWSRGRKSIWLNATGRQKAKEQSKRTEVFFFRTQSFLPWERHSHIRVICNGDHADTEFYYDKSSQKFSSPNISYFLTLDMTVTAWLAFYPRCTSACSKKGTMQLVININNYNQWILKCSI